MRDFKRYVKDLGWDNSSEQLYVYVYMYVHMYVYLYIMMMMIQHGRLLVSCFCPLPLKYMCVFWSLHPLAQGAVHLSSFRRSPKAEHGKIKKSLSVVDLRTDPYICNHHHAIKWASGWANPSLSCIWFCLSLP